MKLVVSLFSLVVAVIALTDQEQWMAFKSQHGKTYKNLREEQLRFQIFANNLRKIEKHNARYEDGLETYEMGVNQFTDLTEIEFSDSLKLQKPFFEPTEKFVAKPNYKSTLKSFDWRTKGAVLSVQDQKNCGSCWAFSATGALEGQNYIKHNQSIRLSVQDLVDCSYDYDNLGCKGGYPSTAFEYVKDHGILPESLNPYMAKKYICVSKRIPLLPKVKLNVTGYTVIEENDDAHQQAVETIGPISVSLNATFLQNYRQGIFNPVNCSTNVSHAVLLVGHGNENGIDYWILKNSWGVTFGEDGYFRMIKNGNTCGILSLSSVPNIL